MPAERIPFLVEGINSSRVGIERRFGLAGWIVFAAEGSSLLAGQILFGVVHQLFEKLDLALEFVTAYQVRGCPFLARRG